VGLQGWKDKNTTKYVVLEGWKFENTTKYVGLEGWDLKNTIKYVGLGGLQALLFLQVAERTMLNRSSAAVRAFADEVTKH
jgi:hypothetical protein